MSSLKTEFAWVNIADVISQSGLATQEQNRNKAVHDLLVNVDAAAAVVRDNLPPEDQIKAQQADSQFLNQQWREHQAQARAITLREIKSCIEKIRIRKKITVVFDASQLIVAASENDITSDVILEMKKVKLDFGPLPELKVKNNTDASTDPDTPPPAPASAKKTKKKS